jgi:hypothetical protein
MPRKNSFGNADWCPAVFYLDALASDKALYAEAAALFDSLKSLMNSIS